MRRLINLLRRAWLSARAFALGVRIDDAEEAIVFAEDPIERAIHIAARDRLTRELAAVLTARDALIKGVRA